MKRIAVGILAHVDAGKTTLSEGLLYESGTIRNLGRVDFRNAFLDTNDMERDRGITIFSKQAVIRYNDIEMTLLDTPGHVDFSAEMERTLWVMDYAVLVISAADGVSGHTLTLWKLLERYNIPTFVFVNKMDQEGADKATIMEQIDKMSGDGFVDFSDYGSEDFYERVAVCDELVLEKYLQGEKIDQEKLADLIAERKLYPCFFGSALKLTGVKEFLDMVNILTIDVNSPKEKEAFGAKVFKISKDVKGERLSFIKITSGSIKVKEVINVGAIDEKINQIRVYSGDKYEALMEAHSGQVVAMTGLVATRPGQGIGIQKMNEIPSLTPVLTYSVELPEEVDKNVMLSKLREMEEEEPELNVAWEEKTSSILVTLMGEVQIEIIRQQIADRYGIDVRFGNGNIVYKETISNVVEGVGHFEPLRHYAEVHIKMEPQKRGSGIQILSDVSEDMLTKNWQNLILTHLEEKEHLGVLTGSPITDMCITLIGGKSHTKHTEGGDFRQATYRAVRQGLMQAESVLLEPYYEFRMELPSANVGRAMTDIEAMYGKSDAPEIYGDTAIITGRVPVSTMRDYSITFNSYTKGMGKLSCVVSGYDTCHNYEEVIENIGYDPDSDIDNPSSSVFCSHGAGTIIPWYEVPEYMHIGPLLGNLKEDKEEQVIPVNGKGVVDYSIDEEQIEAIINKTSHANERVSKHGYKKKKPPVYTNYKGKERSNNGTKYLIVDGYNIVHAWDELKELVDGNLEGARTRLMDILCNYQAYVKCELILVFDAYKVKGNIGEFFDYNNIHVVYTKEAQTADAYIEQLTHKIAKEYQVTVATSDGLIQLITRGQNCMVISARELKAEIERANEAIRSYINNE